MASEWAAKLYDKIARCRTNGEAKELLDAAAEEVARTTMRVDHFYRYGVQPPDIPSHRENEIVKRVLDKLRSHGS